MQRYIKIFMQTDHLYMHVLGVNAYIAKLKLTLNKLCMEVSMNLAAYKKVLVRLLNKALQDEVTAVLSYIRWAQRASRINVRNELLEHARDEEKHIEIILDFASNHGFEKCLKFAFDEADVNDIGRNTDFEILQRVQELERTAIKTYKLIVVLAQKVGDPETCQVFNAILKDEIDHFNDFAPLLKQSRELITDEIEIDL